MNLRREGQRALSLFVIRAKAESVNFKRREFLKSGMALASLAQMWGAHLMGPHTEPMLIRPESLEPFVDLLPIPPVARVAARRPSPTDRTRQIPYYRLPIHEFRAKVHRDIPATRFWGFAGSMPGPTIEARSGEEILVEFPNELPTRHFLPIDHKIMGAEAELPEVRAVVHLHGGKVPAASDGYPEDWYVPGKSATYHYPNKQEAALLWYHDHTMGINRLNTMAGMLGLYVIRDIFEDGLHFPSGAQEVPLVLTDRMFRTDGQLYYPISQRPGGIWVPEFFGDAILLNGKLLPFFEASSRRHRFRILNGSNGRFYRLTLSAGLPMQQIGTDQGLLPAPVEVTRLIVAPGERADVIVDLSQCAGRQIFLENDGRPVMQIRVPKEQTTDSSSVPVKLRSIPKIAEGAAVRVRRLTLDEIDTTLDDPMVHLLDGKRWHEPVSEKPVLGTTEIWELINTTDDTHPIHLHLVRFQILDRRPFDVPVFVYDHELKYTAPAVPPDANEAGWKDTVRASPGAVTRIIVPFEGYPGRYVWHCHILEHEDNEMMRPYEIVSNGTAVSSA
jgi:spore coat protein A